MAARFASHSRWKNQILTASKRDAWHAELDLTNSTIGNDSCDTVQATHEWAVFSCGNAVGVVPVNEPAKYGQAHAKVACGTVSDLSVSPFPYDRHCLVSSADGQVRVFALPEAGGEFDTAPITTIRASGGTANSPVIVQLHPQVSGIFFIASGTKADIASIDQGVRHTISFDSPAISAGWSHDGSKLLIVSKDGFIRVFDARSRELNAEHKLVGTKPVVRALPDNLYVVSNLNRSRERELTLYSIAEPSKALHTWSLGTASTPLIPVIDAGRKIVYLLDKSAGTLRWTETFAPWNEGAASTGVEQSSSGTLISPLALKLMEGEINRFLIADTKGNLVPVKISIGRKSYLEFHQDLFDEIPVAPYVHAEDWFEGQDGSAKVAQLNPELVKATASGQDIGVKAAVPAQKQKATQAPATTQAAPKSIEADLSEKLETATISAPEARKQAQAKSVPQTSSKANDVSAREMRAFERAEAKEKERAQAKSDEAVTTTTAAKPSQSQLSTGGKAKEESSTERIQEKEQEPEPTKASSQDKSGPSIGRGLPPALDDEDALEQARSRRVTPAIESQAAQAKQRSKQEPAPITVESPQPQRHVPSSAGGREVYREDPSQRRAEYGATTKKGSLFAQRMAQYDAVARGDIVREPSPEGDTPPRSSGNREVYREDRTSRRSEYGAPSKLDTTPRPSSSSSVHLKRETSTPSKTPQAAKPASPIESSPAISTRREVYKEDLSARRAEYGAGASSSPAEKPVSQSQPEEMSAFKQPIRTWTAEREIYKEDLTARRAEYGAATPKLEHISTANKEIQKALGNPEPKTPVEKSESIALLEKAMEPPSPTRESLEDAYVVVDRDEVESAQKADPTNEIPLEAIKERSKQSAHSETVQTQSEDIEDTKAAANDASKKRSSTSSTPQISEAILPAFKEYTRKYLTGKMHHPRESYTSFTSLNAGLPNTARLIDANKSTILCPLAGPGGRVGIILAAKPGRLPSFIPALMGGAVVADFELDRFVAGRAVTAHVDQAIRVWQLPEDLESIEADVESPVRTLTGFDRILAVNFHPIVKDLLLVVTPTKLHLVSAESAETLDTFPLRGIANACWSLDGEQIAIGKSDKTIVILDAHDGSEIVSFPSAHVSTRPFRLSFVSERHLVTAGFGKGSTREVALYDIQAGQHLDTAELDISPSPFSLPYFDAVTRVLFLTPRGTSNILAFTVKDDTLVQLPTYSASDPVMGVAFLPVLECNIGAAEVSKALRLTTNEISVVGWEIPRPEGAFFHDDIFPNEVRDPHVAGLNIACWQRREEPKFKMVSLNSSGLKTATSAGIGKQASMARQQTKKAAPKPSSSGSDTASKKKGELDQMFEKAKQGATEDDEPEFTNTASNTRWD